MKDLFTRALRILLVLAIMTGLTARPAMAQDMQILRDAETEAYLAEICSPIVAAAGLRPENVQYVLVNDPTLNAFVATGQLVYVHTGFLLAVTSANEIQGVVAHELGHMTGGDSIRSGNQMQKSSTISILSLLAGAAAMAMGAGEAGMGVMGAGQNAAMNNYLGYSRQQESSADESGRRYLAEAGISSQGMLDFFRKIQNQEYRAGYTRAELAEYEGTHPMTADRIAVAREHLAKEPARNNRPSAATEAKLQRVQAKLFSYIAEPKDTFARYPESNKSVPARYARAYAYHKEARLDEALGETHTLLAQFPHDPYFEEVEGQILLESGRPDEAIPVLRQATVNSGDNPLIATLFGHALMATDNPAYFGEAKTILRSAIARDPDNSFAWYQLGKIYSEQGDQGHAALAAAEQRFLEGEGRGALMSADTAMSLLPVGSADWLRAQDISTIVRQAMGDDKKNRGRTDGHSAGWAGSFH